MGDPIGEVRNNEPVGLVETHALLLFVSWDVVLCKRIDENRKREWDVDLLVGGRRLRGGGDCVAVACWDSRAWLGCAWRVGPRRLTLWVKCLTRPTGNGSGALVPGFFHRLPGRQSDAETVLLLKATKAGH